ncbi:hypothetical protein HMPREF0204_11280 [Chryseobacterium gleum ATCC 35910]|uniref:Uncharacterized protein n=1 Tax=Chryseobacterium gleum ATCC 35910 TaxID=525257 RepID=A0ABN0AUB3_CHRGE|nr:hypothetical protein HMPREF0204_11280 [Chryseobacterium gleum ATCC 35910]
MLIKRKSPIAKKVEAKKGSVHLLFCYFVSKCIQKCFCIPQKHFLFCKFGKNKFQWNYLI